jgi:hypothetical protein
MCTGAEINSEVLIKALAVVLGLSLNILLPIMLATRSHLDAVKERLLPDLEDDRIGHAKLIKLFEWRDLIAAIVTGVFALEFAAADKLMSHCLAVRNAAYIIVFGIVPVMLMICSVLINKLGIRHKQSKVGYWLAFILMVVPWYGAALLFVLSP